MVFLFPPCDGIYLLGRGRATTVRGAMQCLSSAQNHESVRAGRREELGLEMEMEFGIGIGYCCLLQWFR